MANPVSPFTAATEVSVSVKSDERLIVRCDAGASILVYLAVGYTPDKTTPLADYFLTGGDAVEITPRQNTVVTFLTSTGTPKIYYRLEKIEYGS